MSKPADPWVACADRMPASGVEVFAYYTNALGKGRTVRAEYVAPRSIRAEQWLWDDEFEFDADGEGNEWVPAGWWERALMPETSYQVTETVTHWMPIPLPEAKLDKP